jgi:hypothetical protein
MSVVFLCVGAAKAGTSWLHAQLQRHPECHFREIKELHYFSALEHGRLGAELKKHRGWQVDLLERLARSGQVPNDEQARRLADRGAWMDVLEKGVEDVPAYLEYLHGGAERKPVVGELTPAYALLPEARLKAMARMAPDVRFLYVMRDPVERLWSHVRMIAGRRGEATAERCAALLERVLAGREDQIEARSDYAGAIRRLSGAVPGARLLCEVFEEMVSGEGFRRLCAFLGIGASEPDPVPVHAGTELAMTDAQRRAATDWLAPQYDAARAALGRMPEGWGQGGRT